MKCPNCTEESLVSTFTKQAVEVDRCPRCGGVWLDKGEIFHFTRNPAEISRALESARREGRPSRKMSPKTGKAMVELPFFQGHLILDLCPVTEGIWFDPDEIDALLATDPKVIALQADESTNESVRGPMVPPGGKLVIPPLMRLPSLGLRSALTILGLYALLTLVLIACVEFRLLPRNLALMIGIGIAAAQFLFGPLIMDLTLALFYSMEWTSPDRLPPHLEEFVRKLCESKGMKFPRFGIIADGAPNAFTYGHTPNNTRVVVTRGLFNLLEDEEIQAVVAHEIGHAKNWDMLLMTFVQIVPLILYYLYRTLMETKSSKDSKGLPGAGVAIAAYILYIISEYIVLGFSRTREYLADRFAGQATGNPNLLSSALVRIAYGLAGQEKESKQKEDVSRTRRLEALGAFGIFDQGAAHSFAVTTYGVGRFPMGTTPADDRESVMEVMRWDLWNPWARYHELHSTHPLVAKRLIYLSNQSETMMLEPYVRFTLKKPESYWDEFLVDLLILIFPAIPLIVSGIVSALTLDLRILGAGVSMAGLFSLLKLRFSYPTVLFPDMSVSSLLKKVKVSAVRPVPCRLKGRVIGKGVPGLIWSEDFVLMDDTGIIFLDYRQPLRIWEFLFGLMRAEELQNEEVEIDGWYRRSPVPYVELKTLRTKDKTRKCYVYAMKVAFALLGMVTGIIVLFLIR